MSEEWKKKAREELKPLFENWGKEKREAMEAKGATRNSELLESFVKYCQEHPEQRFWQCLRNWCGWSFVLVSTDSNHIAEIEDIRDTFYWEVNEPED